MAVALHRVWVLMVNHADRYLRVHSIQIGGLRWIFLPEKFPRNKSILVTRRALNLTLMMHHWLLSSAQVVLCLGRPILDQEPLQSRSLTSKRSSLTKLCHRLLCLQPEIRLRIGKIAQRWGMRMSLAWLSWLPLQDRLQRQRIGVNPLHLLQKSSNLSQRMS